MWKVLTRLEKAGLYFNLKKCEFNVKTVKYLRFIINISTGI